MLCPASILSGKYHLGELRKCVVYIHGVDGDVELKSCMSVRKAV